MAIDKRVQIEINGLTHPNSIYVNRVGNDATLRCQAILLAKSKVLTVSDQVRYGWEWRYEDEDPVFTSSIAIHLDANGNQLELQGIQASPGSRVRNVKGRCVVHVPEYLVDDKVPKTSNSMLIYKSPYFSIDVAKTLIKPDDEKFVPVNGKYSGTFN